MLVNRHVHLPGFQTITVSNPRQCLFQQLLPNRVTFQVSVSHLRSNTVAFREVVLGIGQPRSCISSVQQLLRSQHLTGDVDALEPFQFLGFGAFTDIHGQLVVQNFLFFLICQVLEELVVAVDFDGEILVDILCNGNCPLLSIENLVGIWTGLGPVHEVQRESVHYRINDGCTLFIGEAKISLVAWPNREAIVVPVYATVSVIRIVLYKVGYLDFGFCDFHNNFLSLPTMLISSALFIIAFIIFCVNSYLEITCFLADA